MAVVSEDLSAQYDSAQSPAPASMVGVVWSARATVSEAFAT
jgi:hypothetical protein